MVAQNYYNGTRAFCDRKAVVLDRAIYLRLRRKAVNTAEGIGLPSFYSDYDKEISASAASFTASVVIRKCEDLIDTSKMHPAHGFEHLRKVAIEAGALAQIEGNVRGCCPSEREEVRLCAQLAGFLHDIRRAENEHTIAGSVEAGRILEGCGMKKRYRNYITAAIRNHEAFREVLPSTDETAKLISDSLYDADKFRWGPDNFTTTLWLILESSGISAHMLYRSFPEKLGWIRRIKDTFRTQTGRKYGPEFIDLGMEIGNEIYQEMESSMEDFPCS
jgi:hypothetical protein